MNNKVKNLIIRISCIVTFLTSIFFVFLFIHYESMSQGFKDSLTYSFSLLSILVTGAAAIVAAALVNVWKKEHEYTRINNIVIEIDKICEKLKLQIIKIRKSKLISNIVYFDQRYKYLDEDKINENIIELEKEIKLSQNYIIDISVLELELKFLVKNKTIFKKVNLEKYNYREFFNGPFKPNDKLTCIDLLQELLERFITSSWNLQILLLNSYYEKCENNDFKIKSYLNEYPSYKDDLRLLCYNFNDLLKNNFESKSTEDHDFQDILIKKILNKLTEDVESYWKMYDTKEGF